MSLLLIPVTVMDPTGMAFDPQHLALLGPAFSSLLKQVKLNQVLFFHSVLACCLGFILILTPHGFVGELFGDYTQFAHEIIRCYGAMTVAQSWITYRCRDISDYRVRKILCECYFGTYLVHFLALIRAQLTSPTSHGITGWMLIFFSLVLCCLYGYFRFAVKIKAFHLPTKMNF